MQSLSPPSPIKSLVRKRPPVIRGSPGKLLLQCIYRSDSVSFPNGVGSNRADWQSSCAILASKVVAQQQPANKSSSGGDVDGGADHVAAVNGHKTSVDLNLVPIEKTASNSNGNSSIKPHQPQKPLTITDLCPAPMHGSHLRVAYQGVPGAYSEAAAGKAYPNSLAQCELTLTKLGLQAAREAVDDTAGAAEYIAANNLRDTAAIASARAAELYGMQGTSVLFKVLSAFAFRNISLTKIESRPHRNRPIRLVDDGNVGTAKHFEYMFYIDFEASMAEIRAQNALAEVQEFTSFLRVLGSYPMDMTPWCPSRGDNDDEKIPF
ncbi:PREPHENATE DEHYDRATASE P PROTEIN [Salix koriyanagi]|uniref:arogenate dehydratase n=1 Tax=Salix koriyanagi TaxID=2511006 RepID=A0A9Q0V1B2_9ROSI|nr:PREPHENATE DEHYDRATASE P PROTEIN [Salix koriyanagi]